MNLEQLWQEYRDADSTPRAWRIYNARAWEAKRRLIYGDPYIKPILPVDDRQWSSERYDVFPVK